MVRSLHSPLAALIIGASALPALAQGTAAQAPAAPAPTPAPADAKLYIIAPADGARLRGPFIVQFGLRNMGVTQAGVATPNTGHHHILIDEDEPVLPGETIPADKSHIHFGGGQTETRLDLPPGRHTLQLVLGDANHQPFKPPVVSEKIHITVLGPRRSKRLHARRYY